MKSGSALIVRLALFVAVQAASIARQMPVWVFVVSTSSWGAIAVAAPETAFVGGGLPARSLLATRSGVTPAAPAGGGTDGAPVTESVVGDAESPITWPLALAIC